MECHSIKIANCLKELRTEEKGLSNSEAERRLKKYGPNEIQEEKQKSKIEILLSQLNNPLSYILILAGTLSVILGVYIDAGVIFGAVLINSIIGFIQENKANQAIYKLKTLVEHKAFVLRDGREAMIESKFVIQGDIILINAGNRIPADARLIETVDLSVNEASLTGESVPSTKQIKEVPAGAPLADRENMVYAGTMVVRGLGRAVVTATGQKTELGKIAELVTSTKEEKTPLQLRLMKFSRFLGIVFSIICVFVVVIGLFQGRDMLEMIETGVAIGVASIPEGLIIAVTFILALGMQKILKERALTRKLVAAETLGSTTVICTDKTGTLTEGKMHVAHIIIGEKEFEIEKPGTRRDKKEALAVSLAHQTGMMCNDAIIENPDDELGSWRFIGTPTETALMSAAIQSGLRKEKLLEIEPKIDELPFDSEKKFMLSLHKQLSSNNIQDKKSKDAIHGKSYILYEKGAPEKLLDKSTNFYHHNSVTRLSSEHRQKLNKTYERLTSRGLRVIGIALKEFKLKKDEPEFVKGKIDWEAIDRELTFIGFIAIKDPLRPEARETISLCRSAGIRPIIITGDHALTAKAIGEEIGLKPKKDNIITGEKLDEVNDEELKKLVKKIDIYARVSPHHKLRIVKALQSRGEVVAMTGDGINDSPALKAADIGISLGTGTDIAKETSDIVLLDNNFKTIVSAVREGRIIFKNIRKVITYLLSDSFAEMILIVGAIIATSLVDKDLILPILPAQILWINIINDGLPHFSLAFEKGNDSVMAEKPIKKDEPLLTKQMMIIIFAVGILWDIVVLVIFFMMVGDFDDALVRTVMFAVLGLSSLMCIFSFRDEEKAIWKINALSNKILLMAVSASFSFLLLGIYWGPLQTILKTVNLNLSAWVIVVSLALIKVGFIELAKLNFRIKKISR